MKRPAHLPITRISLVPVVAAIVTVAACGVESSPESNHETPPTTKADRIFEVLHNPPLLIADGERVNLDFEIVCSATPCVESSGILTLIDAEGGTHEYRSNGAGESLRFTLNPESISDAPVSYRAAFVADGDEGAWPADGFAPTPLYPFTATQHTKLGKADFDEFEDRGDATFSAPWGKGEVGHLGLNDSLEGPTAFDVDDSGTISILDGINGRILHSPTEASGEHRSTPIGPLQDVPDLAIDSEGNFNILYPNGNGKGEGAYVEQVKPSGDVVDRIDLPGHSTAFQILSDGADLRVTTPSGSTTIVADGNPLSPSEQQRMSTYFPAYGERQVIAKHVSDHEVRLLKITDGEATSSWEITSETPLGPIALARATPEGLLAVVSQFSQTDSRHLALALNSIGGVSITPLPDERFVHLTAGGEFKVRGDRLYAGRTTERGLVVSTYKTSELSGE